MLKHFISLIALSILLLLVSACGDGGNMLTGTSTTAQTASTTPAPSAQGTFAEYPLPQDHSNIMRP
ncbi:MAG TPA: hypothetical protein VGN34_18015, partial [Ktedonobacteraceae bacterium]